MYHVDDNWTLMDLIKASFASWPVALWKQETHFLTVGIEP